PTSDSSTSTITTDPTARSAGQHPPASSGTTSPTCTPSCSARAGRRLGRLFDTETTPLQDEVGLPWVFGPAVLAAGAVQAVEVRDDPLRFVAELHEREAEHRARAAAAAAA